MSEDKNTFGDYEFLGWIPDRTIELITSFWGVAGRTYKDWLENGESNSMSACTHGPGPNGFGNPPFGATADYILRDYKVSKELGEERFKIVRGRYIHHWNNIGSIVDENGEPHHVSSCDRWIRVFLHGE